MSFTIDDYTTDWRKVRELQGVSRCRPLNEAERPGGLALFAQKFGTNVALPEGVVFALRPIEVHFVDYTYGAATAAATASAPRLRTSPQITSRVYQIEESVGQGHGPVSTSLNRRAVAPGEVIFRPGNAIGQYYVVLEGEVEVRGEGYGADQTVTRVRAGQMFGDQAAIRGQQGALTAYALTPVILLAVEREAMRDLMLPPNP